MELIIYDEKNMGDSQSRFPFVRISESVGSFSFNKLALRLIGLENGTFIEFLRVEKDPTLLYIAKTSSISGFQIAKTIKGAPNFVSKNMATFILDAAKIPPAEYQAKRSAKFKISDAVQINGREMFQVDILHPF